MSEADRNKWQAKYREADRSLGEPSSFLLTIADRLPTSGRALDLAGGMGRHAVWLAQRGLDVTLADISPIALEIAQGHATEKGLKLSTVEIDLEIAPPPQGPWDLVLSSYFLRRPLLSKLPALLSPGGVLIVIQPTRTNLTRHDKPPAPFLLNDGELPTLIVGLETVVYNEDWSPEDRYEARLLARRAQSE